MEYNENSEKEVKSKYRLYKDSKEIPYRIFERIETTGDFSYLVKGYDQSEQIELDKDFLQEKYNEIIQDFTTSVNIKSLNLIEQGNILAAQNELCQLYCIQEAIDLKILRDKIEKSDNSVIYKMLENIKIPKPDELEKLRGMISDRISKNETQIEESRSRIEKDNKQEESSLDEKMDPNKIFIYVENGLERSLDMDKVTLYQFGILQDLLNKKIEHLNTMR